MEHMCYFLYNHQRREDGHALIEYALIMVLMSVALLAALIVLFGGVEEVIKVLMRVP